MKLAITDDDIATLVAAARCAQLSGADQLARRLDTLARKAQAAAQRRALHWVASIAPGAPAPRWQDLPSVLS